MNLLFDPWIPVHWKDGSVGRIAPWQLTEPTNPAIAVAAFHAPLNGALTEFLVALFQTAFLPDHTGAWRKFWNEPPSADYLGREFSKFEDLFDLQGTHPFMQDRSLSSDPEKYRKPIQQLFVDRISDEQEKNHSDLFTKSGTVTKLCAACAAAALWDTQAHAGKGGRGYHTSLRGGGPHSNLILCDTLWKTVWGNVVEQDRLGLKGRPDPKAFLPWVRTVSSDEVHKVNPDEESPLHVFWGMPRRILLEWDGSGRCDRCGQEAAELCGSFLAAPKGFQYKETDWRHPLSPYKTTKEGDWVVRNTESDLVGYRHWVGLLVDTPSGDGVPALSVRRWLERDVPKEPHLRIWGYGYQTHEASILGWCEGKMPIIRLENGHRQEFDHLIVTLVTLSQRGEEKLTEAIGGALKSSGSEDKGARGAAAGELWRQTEPLFLEEIRKAADLPSEKLFEEIKDAWVGTIQRTALRCYERHLPASRCQPEWVARYAHKLRRQLSGRDPVTLKTRKFGDWRLTSSP